MQYTQSFTANAPLESDILAFGKAGNHDEDVWCIDTRGVLSIAACKQTYERLGTVGQQLPWKGCEFHIIEICLHKNGIIPETPATRFWHRLGDKVAAALSKWDSERGPWQIIYTLKNTTDHPAQQGSIEHVIKPVVRIISSIHIPDTELSAEGEEELEDIASLYEWVGMACMGAQRLQANDRVDPYIAVYSPPTPSHIGDLTHVRWTGLLPPDFVQQLISSVIMNSSHDDESLSVRAITAQGVPTVPVNYIPRTDHDRTRLRAPREDSVDTWSLLLQRRENRCHWVLAENIGKWDGRFG